ncbi:hypothetical protein GOV04_03340 [Candidatus Woesearchaeota archaeon]|nr:hypothetical protein [Candidatus Woesearchaeota archaeon]
MIDNDGDAYSPPEDCDDNDASINPSATEIPYDSIDQDCQNGDLTDVDGDGYDALQAGGADCNDNNPAVHPGTVEILDNGVDDDCNGATPDTLLLEVITNKQTYSLGDGGSFTAIANNGADMTISILAPNSFYYEWNYFNQTYPVTEIMPYIRKVGTYTLVAQITYGGASTSTTKTFEVTNNLAADIDYDRKVQRKKETTLKATASGGIGTVNYRWNLDGVSKTGSEITHTFDELGSETVKLTITDSENNTLIEDFTIKVVNKYKLIVNVLDSTTNHYVEDAKVEVDDTTKTAINQGRVEFILEQGTYEVHAYNAGYKHSFVDVTLDKNKTINVKLEPTTNSAPQLTLHSTNARSNTNTISLEYSVISDHTVDCELLTSTDNNWWSSKAEQKTITTNSKLTFTLQNQELGNYYYKIECTDVNNQKTTSNTENYKIIGEENYQSISTQDYNQQIDNAIEVTKTVSGKDGQVIQLLNIDQKLYAAKRQLGTYNSDIYNIENPMCPGRYCNIASEVKQDYLREVEEKIENLSKYTVLRLQIISDDKYVKYPSDKELETTLQNYLNQKSIDISSKAFKKLLSANEKLQSKLSTTKKHFKARITYLNGLTEEITIISKELSVGNNTPKKTKIVEFLPEKLTRSNIVFVDEPIKILDDNLVEYEIDQKTITYYTITALSASDVEKSQTYLLTTEQPAKNSITGFAIFDGSQNKKVLVLILLVVIASIAYLVYNHDILDKLAILKTLLIGHDKRVSYVNVLINDALDYLKQDDTQKAGLIYREIKLTYEQYPRVLKNELYDSIRGLCAQLDIVYAKKLVVIAKAQANKNQITELEKTYSKLNLVYQKLPEKNKEEIINSITEITALLGEKTTGELKQ